MRTQSRVLILCSSLSEFMRKLGMDSVGGSRTRLRNQMRRLFNAHVQLVYEDKLGEAEQAGVVGALRASRAAAGAGRRSTRNGRGDAGPHGSAGEL